MEVLNSIFTSIKDKLTNPFFGTLILVLLIHHWELWFTIFNFDSGLLLDVKLQKIRDYAKVHFTIGQFAWDIFQAAIFMILGYLLIVATRSLVLWVEYWLWPWLTGKIISKNIVLKSEYDEVVKQRQEYFNQYEEQRKNVRDFSKIIDDQTLLIKKYQEENSEQSKAINTYLEEVNGLNRKSEKLQLELQTKIAAFDKLAIAKDQLEKIYEYQHMELEMFNGFFSKETNFFNSTDKFPPPILNKVVELKNNNTWSIFLKVGAYFENGGIMSSEMLDQMIKENVVSPEGSPRMFTPLGKIIWTYHLI